MILRIENRDVSYRKQGKKEFFTYHYENKPIHYENTPIQI